jgi:alcohol dehydrogenase (cytochrome c)
MVVKRERAIRTTFLASAATMMMWPATAAEVTYERLLSPEPQNWLMNHRTYDGQRFSPLDRINRGNVRGLSLPMQSHVVSCWANELGPCSSWRSL